MSLSSGYGVRRETAAPSRSLSDAQESRGGESCCKAQSAQSRRGFNAKTQENAKNAGECSSPSAPSAFSAVHYSPLPQRGRGKGWGLIPQRGRGWG